MNSSVTWGLAALVAVIIVAAGVVLSQPTDSPKATVEQTAGENGGTRIEAPFTKVESDANGTRIQAPGVDIQLPPPDQP
jgi:hypothetical protein